MRLPSRGALDDDDDYDDDHNFCLTQLAKSSWHYKSLSPHSPDSLAFVLSSKFDEDDDGVEMYHVHILQKLMMMMFTCPLLYDDDEKANNDDEIEKNEDYDDVVNFVLYHIEHLSWLNYSLL